MRLKIAAALVLVGLLAMGAGVGLRTIWAPPETITSTLSADTQQAPVTVLDSALNDQTGGLEVTIESEAEMVVALGRAADVDAWVGDAAHLRVEGYDGEQLETSFTEGEEQVPNPRGSDLWVSQETAEGELVYQWIDPARGEWSLLLATDGTEPAPAQISITHDNPAGTPWSIPLIVIGSLLTVFGLVLLFGPKGGGKRGKRQDGPAPAAGTRAYARQSEARSKQRGRATRVPATRVSATRVPAAGALSAAGLVLTLAVAPAAQAMLPATVTDESASPAASSPAPSATGQSTEQSAGEAEAYPVLLPGQLERIMDSVANTVAAADAAGDASELESRVAGPALTLRRANYEIRAGNPDHREPAPIASDPILAELITSTVEWPRAVVTVTQGEENEVPQAILLVQNSPRENYTVRHAVQLLPGTTFPQAADTAAGTQTLPDDSDAGLLMSPAAALAGVAEVLTKPDSDFADQLAENTFVEQITAFQKEQIDSNENANIEFTHTVVEDNTWALRTGSGGALVFGYLSNSMTSTPEEEGGTVELDEDYAALAGDDSTEEGVSITFGESVMLYVPPAGSDEQVQVIGAAQDLVEAELMDD